MYVVTGSLEFEVGDRSIRASARESVFVPRKVPHVWVSATDQPCTTIHVYQPAGRMEEFFREVGRFNDPPSHEALSFDEVCRLFQEHGVELVGPPLPGWAIEDGRIVPPS